MSEPLFLKPVFHEKLWGGRLLEKDFGYQLPAGKIGECWSISGHPHGTNVIENGQYQGQLLSKVYENHPELFGNPVSKVFPLLVKFLDAEASLSVQVHPDNAYAAEHEGELGKTECWYVLHAEPGAYLIYGHHAKTQAELRQMIEAGDWEHLLRKKYVKTGDFVYVPSGTIHALNKGIEVIETQQSSDTTYRLYDYDRVEEKTGKKRELHLQQSIDVTDVPFKEPVLNIRTKKIGSATITTLVKPPISPYFSVYKWDVQDELKMKRGDKLYILASVIAGSGRLEVDGKVYDIKKGTNFILPNDVTEWKLVGKLSLVVSNPE
ncbi:mannose-6-phosphate isomerase, class I [Liquorilactobacillus nagelii]|jgi:mannose-6-phosphate isomerase|uniref:mannose-6-phosphate isomerase, class I n=1 Tax=Liquorilactobacillus nagelii TaxID=82688 RepID=UPI0006F0313F|nr:mannose-6-phosphate isomerase, class I [Liquorilactobacillus nagelii]KRL40110.1 mannose-6-phosphate isomerase [Liquorilactobacillus nagelii DSM 13675]QYH54101.1 mannose-6-phosphate isomerase, class I [Liquorilactobacillus nagelii DSM 13675]